MSTIAYDMYYESKRKIKSTDYLKVLFTVFSIFLLSQCLFGSNHDVLGFYRSLFLLSSPILFDIIEDVIILHNLREKDYKMRKLDFRLLIAGLFFSTICFAFSIIALFAKPDFQRLYDHVNSGNNWEYGIIFFVLYILCFLLYPAKKIILPLIFNKPVIELEERPQNP